MAIFDSNVQVESSIFEKYLFTYIPKKFAYTSNRSNLTFILTRLFKKKRNQFLAFLWELSRKKAGKLKHYAQILLFNCNSNYWFGKRNYKSEYCAISSNELI